MLSVLKDYILLVDIRSHKRNVSETILIILNKRYSTQSSYVWVPHPTSASSAEIPLSGRRTATGALANANFAAMNLANSRFSSERDERLMRKSTFCTVYAQLLD